MKDKSFIAMIALIFLFIFVASPTVALLSRLGYMDALSTRNLVVAEREYPQEAPAARLLNGIEQLKADVRNIYVNCLPFYTQLVSSVQYTEYALLKLSEDLLRPALYGVPAATEAPQPTQQATQDASGQTTQPFQPVSYISTFIGESSRRNYYAIEPLHIIDLADVTPEERMWDNVDVKIDGIERITASRPDLDYFVYYCTRAQDNELCAILMDQSYSAEKYVEYFLDGLPAGVKYDTFKLSTVEDRLSKQYKSDHHWNPYGAYEGYVQMADMMELGEAREVDILKVPGLKWTGLSGSYVGFFDKRYEDDFYIFDFTALPRLSGQDYDLTKRQNDILTGKYNDSPSSELYLQYNSPAGKVVCEDNDTGRNLLLIGDSFSWSILPLLASHFDTTLAYVNPWGTKDSVKYDYGKIIDDNNITDVLICVYGSALVYGNEGSDLDNFVTD